MSLFSDIFGGGNSGAVTNSIPPELMKYIVSIADRSQTLGQAGDFSKVAGLNSNLTNAIDQGGAASTKALTTGMNTLGDQSGRLTEMAKTGGAEELKDALALDIGMGNAGLNNQFGGGGVLGSARHNLAAESASDAAKAKYAQQVISNKAAAESALGGNVGQQGALATGSTNNLINLGNTQRTIEQQQLDAPYQGLSREAGITYGQPARQSATPGK